MQSIRESHNTLAAIFVPPCRAGIQIPLWETEKLRPRAEKGLAQVTGVGKLVLGCLPDAYHRSWGTTQMFTEWSFCKVEGD